jgi:hypothetical protein
MRPHPEPALLVIGELDEADQRRLEALRYTIKVVLPDTRHLTYEAVEESCRSLAGDLAEKFGTSRLRASRFRAIPRGGFVVLGMLSYLLDLDDPEGGDGPLIVVDDCAISGARFRRYLADLGDEEEIVFAHLYSTPELRSAIELAEPRVLCASGGDLTDRAPARLGPDHADWQHRWRNRTGDTAYWLGQPEHIVLPWNEPDSSFWNPVTGREEEGWRLAPANRSLSSGARLRADVFVIPEAADGIRPHPETVWAWIGERVIVGNLETETVLSLDGSAAHMWEALVIEGSEEATVQRISTLYDADAAGLRDDVANFVAELKERHLIE